MTAERQEYVTKLTQEEINKQESNKTDEYFTQNAADYYKDKFGIKIGSIMSENIDSRFNMLKEQRDQAKSNETLIATNWVSNLKESMEQAELEQARHDANVIKLANIHSYLNAQLA